MNNYFNVSQFDEVIKNISSKSTTIEERLANISANIENLRNCIGNQDNSSLYQAWGDLKVNLDKVTQKYSERKGSFLSELTNYKDSVVTNNDQIYQNINRAVDFINSISNKIDSL